MNFWKALYVVLSVISAGAATAAVNQADPNLKMNTDRYRTEASAGVKDPTPSALSREARNSVDGVRSIVNEAARQDIGRATRSVMPDARATSIDRSPRDPLYSSAHVHGAVDYSVRNSQNVDRDARAIARSLGTGYTTIHEEPMGRQDRNTTYKLAPPRTEMMVRDYFVPHRATAEHLHVQPNYFVKS